MLSKLKIIEEESDLQNLIRMVKNQTSEESEEKITKMLKENDYDYITVIKLIMGINIKIDNNDNKVVKNLNKEKYNQIRNFMDSIYFDNKK